MTKVFPPEEKYGLTIDIRRSANSILQNIAEGYGRFEPRDKTRFYKISRGSSYELMSQSIASYKLGYIKEEKILEEILSETNYIIQELNSLIKSIETRIT
ncbi:MAG TPA: four helix bundle protein [Ignavibacteriaceae bacterium]|nr:four helix bundle protein [Ignavibacteriaceae bacterium]